MKLVGFSAENLMFHDGIPFAAERGSPAVERDENGVPSAWRIFVEGENSLTKNGEAGTLTLDAEDMATSPGSAGWGSRPESALTLPWMRRIT